MTELLINGKTHKVDADPDMPLLWVLRDLLGLTGSKYGCGAGLCGACTVHLNGAPTRSCLLPISAVGKAAITTIEGLAGGDDSGRDGGRVLHAVQQAWLDENVPQCGYCQCGQIMSAVALLRDNPKPGDADIDAAMSGNLCRCGTYTRIRRAIKRAANGGKPVADNDVTTGAGDDAGHGDSLNNASIAHSESVALYREV